MTEQRTFCRLCKKEIPENAKKCHYCQEYQNKWVNWALRSPVLVSFVMVFIAVVQVFIGYNQMQEAKKERVLASTALNKASQAESAASSASGDVSKLSKEAKKQVDQIKILKDETTESLKKIRTEFGKVQKDSIAYKSYIDETKEKMSTELSTVAAQVQILKDRNMLVKLGDEAIAKGDAKAFEELENYLSKGEKRELESLALAEIFRVKGFYITGSRIEGVSISYPYAGYISPSAQLKSTDAEIPTFGLIKILKEDPVWQARAKAAQLLNLRPEKGVPEALLMAFNDENLDVRKIALNSFSAITGFKKIDVFGFVEAKNWWEKNKEEKNKQLKDQ